MKIFLLNTFPQMRETKKKRKNLVSSFNTREKKKNCIFPDNYRVYVSDNGHQAGVIHATYRFRAHEPIWYSKNNEDRKPVWAGDRDWLMVLFTSNSRHHVDAPFFVYFSTLKINNWTGIQCCIWEYTWRAIWLESHLLYYFKISFSWK